jgi:hypothetical protein
VKTDFVHQIYLQYPSLRAVPLEQGFTLFPLTNQLLDNLQIPRSTGLEGFSSLPNELTDLLANLSAIGPLLCFETDYFGGWGSQLAIVFENGKITFGPAQNSIGPINDGLRLLGVQAKADIDEFDTLGLGKNRHTTDWLK